MVIDEYSNSRKLRPAECVSYLGTRGWWRFVAWRVEEELEFCLCDGWTKENYSEGFDMRGYAIKYYGAELPDFKYDFSVKIFSYDEEGNRVELANVGINYKDVYKPFVYNPKLIKKSQLRVLDITCFTLFVGIFRFVFATYRKKCKSGRDIAVVVFETLRHLNKLFVAFRNSRIDVFEYTESIRALYGEECEGFCIPCQDVRFEKNF